MLFTDFHHHINFIYTTLWHVQMKFATDDGSLRAIYFTAGISENCILILVGSMLDL